MYAEKQTHPLSYFGICGIHGLPYEPWASSPDVSEPENKVTIGSEDWLDGSNGDKPPQTRKGYCTHGNVLFPTWHRPYVALYEVCTVVSKDVANTYNCSKYLASTATARHQDC